MQQFARNAVQSLPLRAGSDRLLRFLAGTRRGGVSGELIPLATLQPGPRAWRSVRLRASEPAQRAQLLARDLERYQALLEQEFVDVTFSESEAWAICDALNGVALADVDVPLLWQAVERAVRQEELASRWQVDGEQLVGRLRSLSRSQCYALLQAVECFWTQSVASARGLERCGLIVVGTV